MPDNEFEKLIATRKDWVKSSKENKFDFDSILASLYNDPSHFIYEILQNAEDASAKTVHFELFEDRLDIRHNGRDFDFKDIEGVTGIGISTKKTDLTAIGKFGVGFKSVFAVTETPHIFSGEYKIKIDDFVIPSVINNSESINGTLIRLPFNHKTRSSQDVFVPIAQKLENLGFKTLLFLKNIKEIKWQIPSSGGHYLKSSESLQNIPNAKKITLISEKDTEEYIVIERPITIENKELKVEVAYRIGKVKDGKEIIIAEPDSKLVVFFPTEKVTFLNFVIQGPYKTTPNRENIPLGVKQNKKIIDETACLVADSLSVIKDLGYLDVNFLNLLPINPHKKTEPIYSAIYEKVKEKLLSDDLLPTSDGKHAKATDVLLARGKELTEFLNSEDTQKLFSKRHWLETNITEDKTPELRKYLKDELKIEEIDFESFARKITAEFLQTKSDEWMIDFYGRLLDQQSLWSDRGYSKGVLRTKPIIRLDTGKHIAPFDNNGQVKVYLPAETKSKYYPTVKPILTENEDSMKFLKALGLIKPDLFAEIREFIFPKYQTENPIKDEGYFEDIEKLLKFYEDKNVSENKKREFMEELSKASFIDSVHNGTEENHLRKPSETYFNDKDLKDYFDGYHSVYFVSDALYEKFGEEKLKSFLKKLGVEDKPRRIETEKVEDLHRREKIKLVGFTRRDVYRTDYEYEGLENFIKEMSIYKSWLLWKLLLKNIEGLSSSDAKNFFEGKLKWKYDGWNSRSFDAKFTEILRQQAWLVDKNNNFRKASDITLSELSDDYIKESPNIDVLKKVLGFKPDFYDQLPEDVRKRIEITKDIPEEELIKFASTFKKEPSGKEEEKTWIPEHEPNKNGVPIKEVLPDKIVTPDLTRQGEQINSEESKESTTEYKVIEEDDSKTQSDKKAIGKWGEEQVYNNLQVEYKKLGAITETDSGFKAVNASKEEFEIVWLNKQSDKGKGCDFVVKKSGDEIEYIEVKAKTQEDAELIEVTGTQWELARKLYEQGEGDKYFFYLVLNVGKETAQIKKVKNPTKLWKEGRLYAHPVNFKL